MEFSLENTVLPNKPMPVSRIPTIPLNLFQTWHSEVLPPKMFECVNALKQANPEFNHLFFNDANCRSFIQQYFDEHVLHAYDILKPGAYKADLWRYCVLYIMGGIYVDIKYRCIPPFKLIELTTQEHFIRDRDYGNNPGVYQAILACYPKNPILHKCIHSMVTYVNQMEYGANVLFVGPLLVASYFNRSEILSWPMQYTGMQIVRETPIMEIYPEYYAECNTNAIRSYYMDLWCKRDIYSWKSLPSIQQTTLTRYITTPKPLWLTGCKWIQQGNERVLFNQWSSYKSHEDGTFTGNPIQYVSRMQTPHFTGDETLFDKELSHFTLYQQDTIRYAFIDKGICGGEDTHGLCIAPLSTTEVTHLSPIVYKNATHFISSWHPMVILDSKFQVMDIKYHVHSFLKGMTSSVPCIVWKQQYWTVLTKCVHYEINKIPLKKYAHIFVVMDESLSMVKYSEFFVLDNSTVSIVTDFHIQENVFSMAYSTSNGIFMVSEYASEDILKLHWNYVTP
jgi:hypothetical protein